MYLHSMCIEATRMFVSALAWIYVSNVVLNIVFADVAILIVAKKFININKLP